jgi:hypothetical protein
MAGPKTKGKSMDKKCARYKTQNRRESNKAKKILKEEKRQERFAKRREQRKLKATNPEFEKISGDDE